jgi:hypothetical protein
LVGCEAFDLANDHIHAHAGIDIKQEMDMIGQDFDFQDEIPVFSLLGKDKLFRSRRDRFNQYLAAILWAKDNMVLTTVDDTVIGVIGFVRLSQFDIPPFGDDCLQYNKEHLCGQWLKRLKQVKPLYPKPKGLGFYGLFS